MSEGLVRHRLSSAMMIHLSSIMSIRVGGVGFLSSLPSVVWKGHCERGAKLARERDRPPQLLCQHRDDLQSEGLRVAEIEVRGEAHPGIAHTQGHVPDFGPEHDVDVPGATIRKGIFQRVREEFVQDEPARYSGIEIEDQLVELGVQTDVGGVSRIGLEKLGTEGVDVVREIKARKVAGAV
jgi:hypothetical protein